MLLVTNYIKIGGFVARKV